MTTVFAFFDELDPEEFRRATEVTYLGSIWGFKAALDRMVPRDRGSIVQVGSALGYQGIPLQSAYCGAKHGVQGVFESLRCELAHRRSNVSLSIVQLPGLNTPAVRPLPREAPERADAGTADLPARGGGGGGPLRRPAPPATDLRRRLDRLHRLG
jgi:NAD(P)-dependent dehydrogenase (short-subunit alcohol dehydrogenase family)